MACTSSPFDQRQLRNVFGRFVTGVAVMTTSDGGDALCGVTANSFSSVSLDPPLVIWNQSLTSKRYPKFRDCKHFIVNILADDQIPIADHFTQSHEEMFRGIEYHTGIGGVPILDGTAAYLECARIATYSCGDHAVYLGEVKGISQETRRPLAFISGRYISDHVHNETASS